jgi:transposase
VEPKIKKVHTTIPLDLAKIVIQACHIDRQGEILLNKPIFPEKTEQFLVQAKPCVVGHGGMWQLSLLGAVSPKYGHTVKGKSSH